MAGKSRMWPVPFASSVPPCAPQSVTVVLSDETLVITPARALRRPRRSWPNRRGAAMVQNTTGQLFAGSSDAIAAGKIRRIHRLEVREADAGSRAATGTVVHAFTHRQRWCRCSSMAKRR